MTKGPKDALSRLTHKEYEQSATVSDRQDDMSEYEMEVEEMADGFVGDDQLETCHVRGEPDIRVADTCRDGAFDMHCTWRDTAGEDATQEPKNNEDREPPQAASMKGIQPGEATQQGMGRVIHGSERPKVPPLAICIMICGTRGDAQPFVALGLELKEYGHRVRIATHAAYREHIAKVGLEFFPLGGDPKILSAFIVKHRGVFTVNAKDAHINMGEVEKVIFSCYDACTEPDPDGGPPFKAQAIIANPPVYGHIHCAEKLQIPLHVFFTMPWTPTKTFPHPLSRLKAHPHDKHQKAVRNWMSYSVVNDFTYTGLSMMFNRFRKKLHLAPIRTGNNGADILTEHKVPFGYCWSPSLVAKPKDWGDNIDITGYFLLKDDAMGEYTPPRELASFLAAGPAPVYLGFGSLILDNPKLATRIILEAIQETGQRLILSRGWAKLGEGFDLPETVLSLGDAPHSWLLPQCSGVVHHGGAGTTAAGLIAACPTLVIPFFGDQNFWGAAVYHRGVGPKPIPIDKLKRDRLVEALRFMQKPEVKAEAEKISRQIKSETGAKNGVQAFHRHLPVEDIIAGRPKKWKLTQPTLGGFMFELGGGLSDVVMQPYHGAKEEGAKGAVKGIGKGLEAVVTRPIKGIGLAVQSIAHAVPHKSQAES